MFVYLLILGIFNVSSYARSFVVRYMGVGPRWVGLGHGSTSSPGSGLGWVGSVIWWVGLGVGR